MTNKSIMIDLNDTRSGKIAEIISNKTCRQVIDLLADRELSVSEIASELKIPVNTTLYNVEKLSESGLIEKANWMWSIKGKRIEKYKLSNKRIVISPRKLTRGIIPALVVGGVGAYLVSMINRSNFIEGAVQKTSDVVSRGGAEMLASGTSGVANSVATDVANGVVTAPVQSFVSNVGISSIPAWEWFALGALVTVAVYLIYDLIYERRQR